MKMAKRLLAGSFALIMAASLASCGGKGGSDASSEGKASKFEKKQEEQVNKLVTELPDKDLKNKTIKWLAHYKINPVDGKAPSASIQLFNKKYGGKITETITTYETRYDQLATLVMSGKSPDFFPADDMDTFPKGAIKNMFDPVDDYVDFSADTWADVKDVNDQFSLNGKHYIVVIEPTPDIVCFYNKTTIEDNGFEDPAELYKEGKWDWDVFEKMCKDFTDAEEDLYALDGYWYTRGIEQSCGVPLITIEDGKIVQNLSDPEVEKIQDRMYDLQKNEVCFPRADNDWNTRGNGENGNGLGSYQTLFIPIGIWGIEDTPENTKLFGDIAAGEVMFVPMPKNPESDVYYMAARVHGFTLCHNAPNPEGFAAYMDCCKLANSSDVVSKIWDEQLKKDYKWTDELIEMRKECYKLAKEHPVFDLQEGVSADLKTLMEQSVREGTMVTNGEAKSWTEVRTENESAVNYLLKEANAEMKG